MSNEIRVQISLQIRDTNSSLFYQSQPSAFLADRTGTRGPTPASIVVTVAGVTVSLAQLTALGGMCWMQNLDLTNYVEYGVYDPDTTEFYPFGELLPGEVNLVRLSRFLGEEMGAGTGSGTSGSGVLFQMRAVGGSCVVRCDAFDK